MIDEFELKRVLALVSKQYDFTIELIRTCNEEKYGEYFPNNRRIVLYVLDDEGEYVGDERVVLEGLHEVAHHCQSKRRGFKFTNRNEHGYMFREYYSKYLARYYGLPVPSSVLDDLETRGYLSPRNIKTLKE